MKYTIIIALILAAQAALPQVKTTHLKKTGLPAAIKYKGEFTDAIQYADKEGIHIVLTTEDILATPADDNENVYTGSLHAYSYLEKANGLTLSWQLNDDAGPCGADLDARYRAGSLAVTDLDQNGVCEVWLIYRVSCHGYQTPSPMKVIMHEGSGKFAMRGMAKLKLKVTPVQYKGGDYTFDEAFNAGPEAFRHYAKALWVRNQDETASY